MTIYRLLVSGNYDWYEMETGKDPDELREFAKHEYEPGTECQIVDHDGLVSEFTV